MFLIKEDHQLSLLEIIQAGKTVPEEAAKGMNKEKTEVQSREKMLEQLKGEAENCSKCALRAGCSRVVFGEGYHQARLMLVGEGPGGDEDRLGVPFVGRAGQLLNKILQAAGIDRDSVYITNVVKCRPPQNRVPFQPEIDSCLPYLHKQIELVDPDIVVCLGALANRTLIDKGASITRNRGKWKQAGKRRYIATFHPAALLRDPGKKKYVWEDFKIIMDVYHGPADGGDMD